jgi:hypothetical protein
VIATLEERPTRVEESRREIAEILDDDYLLRIHGSSLHGDPAIERRQRVEALVRAADGRRAPLEKLRFGLQQRLHAASDDFEATEGLRVVEAALPLVPRRGEEFWQKQRSKLRRLARRRRLRRASAR